MKFFVDSANLADIESALARGFIRGVTTNPSLLSREPKTAFKDHIKNIVALIKKYQPDTHLSVEVFSKNPDEIIRQAYDFLESFDHPHLSIKIHVGWDELAAIRRLSKEGVSVNCTCCMTISQAAMAAAAGARYVSIFWGRIRDMETVEKNLADPSLPVEKRAVLASHALTKAEYLARGVLEERHFDPSYVVESVRKIIDHYYPSTEIIAGSIRKASDVKNAGVAGAHIITVPPKFFPDLISNFKTDEVVQEFFINFEKWLS